MPRSPLAGFSILRAALLGTTALVLLGPTTTMARVGVTSATDGDPLGKPPAEAERVLRIGIDVQANEVITTGGNDRAHLVFLDGTSLTVGPNAQLTIDKFVYDPNTKTGELAVNASKGVLRLVGGKISKTNPITITTPSSTIGIRGGITIVDIQPNRTVSTFVFGDRMTVSGRGQIQTATRPGSQVTTASGGTPSPPALVAQGGLTGQLGQLEGTRGSNNNAGNNNPIPGGSGGSGPNAPTLANADQGAQTFGRQNSSQGPALSAPPGSNLGPIGQGTPGPLNPNNNPATGAVSNTNRVRQAQSTTNSPTSTTTTTTNNTTQVIVSYGRYIADPAYTGFNQQTLGVTPVTNNNVALSSSATVTNGSSVTIKLSDNRSIALPWRTDTLQSGFSISSFPDPTFGTLSGTGYISATGNYFAYVLTNQNNQKVAFFGGPPTPNSGLPTSGKAAYTLTNLTNPGALPFADATVGGNADLVAAAKISNLYVAFSANNGVTVGQQAPGATRSTEMQSTISISGVGANQKSYMGVFVGDIFTDANNSSTMSSGGYTGSYRTAANQNIGRLTSSVSTPDTGGGGDAIYGSTAQVMVFTPDKASTSFTTSGSNVVTSITTTRTSQAALDQAVAGATGQDYYTVNQAAVTTAPTVGTQTQQTVNGFVGGIAESSTNGGGGNVTTRTFGTSGASPTDFSLTTTPSTNRASASITVQQWDGTSTSATFQLGGTSGGTYATSSYIDDNTYALRDRPADSLSDTTSVSVRSGNSTSTSTGSDVTSRTAIVSAGSNPGALDALYAAANQAVPNSVTACTCAFLTWGWWSGNVNYGANSAYNASGSDRINLATYVAGTLTSAVNMPNTGSATYNGDMIGNVRNGGNSYIAVGGYSNSWSFASQTGVVTVTNFDGTNYSGNTALTAGTVKFTGSISSTTTSVPTRTGSLSGAFFNNGATPAAGQAGSFAISGTNYQAGGTFKAQK